MLKSLLEHGALIATIVMGVAAVAALFLNRGPAPPHHDPYRGEQNSSTTPPPEPSGGVKEPVQLPVLPPVPPPGGTRVSPGIVPVPPPGPRDKAQRPVEKVDPPPASSPSKRVTVESRLECGDKDFNAFTLQKRINDLVGSDLREPVKVVVRGGLRPRPNVGTGSGVHAFFSFKVCRQDKLDRCQAPELRCDNPVLFDEKNSSSGNETVALERLVEYITDEIKR
jgi:hypothetical protein